MMIHFNISAIGIGAHNPDLSAKNTKTDYFTLFIIFTYHCIGSVWLLLWNKGHVFVSYTQGKTESVMYNNKKIHQKDAHHSHRYS